MEVSEGPQSAGKQDLYKALVLGSRVIKEKGIGKMNARSFEELNPQSLRSCEVTWSGACPKDIAGECFHFGGLMHPTP